MSFTAPLRLAPRYAEVLWGGKRLASVLGKSCPSDRAIGESWEVFGANLITSGGLAGRTLDEAARLDGPAILGRRVLAEQDAADGFPLLIKFIDACLPLSVQVHPDDAYARAHENGSRGKTEAWYIIDAPPGGRLIYGLREGMDAARVARSVAENTLADSLAELPVRAGDAVFVPAGTVHAITAGILLYEVQQRSEITYRLYDWGRVGPDGRPRPLHIEKAIAAIRFPQPPPRTTPALRVATPDGARIFLAACRYFALVALEGMIEDTTDGESFAALSVVNGTARLWWQGGEEQIARGETVVLPAGLGAYRLAISPGGRVLRSTVPDLAHDVIAPLRAAGYQPAEISALGAVSP
jgi:mannose-6-phosphate isomerase